MAVHLSIHPGYDPSYPWKQIGAEGDKLPRPLEYYLTPVDAEGEPPGVWHGRAARLLGFADGELIDRAEFEKLFGEHVNPRTGEHLGRAMYNFKTEDDIYRDLAAAEPYASEGRKAELRSQARRRVRRAVPYFDFTMSVSKDISLTYGSLLAWEEDARRKGDLEAAARWAEKAAKVPAAIEWARERMMNRLQDQAGYTRTGGHRGSGGDSRPELGKFEDAHEWLYGSFFQHTSRDGDPQLHVHNLVLNKVPLMKDGEVEKWLTIDAQVAFSMRREAAAVAAVELEARLSADLGVVWEPRPDGNGRQIAGVSQAMMDLFSHRRRTIKAEAAKLAAEREAVWGKAPTARQMDRMQRDITQKTRKAKKSGALDLAGHLREWAEQAAESDLGDLKTIWTSEAREGERDRVRREVVSRTAELIAAEVEQRDGRPVGAEARRQIGAYAAYITRNGEFAGPADPADLAAGYAATRADDMQKLAEAFARYEAEEIVTRTAQAMCSEFTERVGRGPDAAESARMERFVKWVTLGGAEKAQYDAALLLRAWQAQESGDALREQDIRRDIEQANAEAGTRVRAERAARAMARAAQETGGGRLGAMERAYAVAYPVQGGSGLTEDQARQVIARALETAQSKKTKWPRADLAARIGELLPRGAQADEAVITALAERALSGNDGAPVVLLDPPQWPVVPASLRRSDGESVFVRHGTMQYATQAQLTLEETLLAQAQAPDAPRLLPDLAAQLLGADPARLAALLGPADEPGTGEPDRWTWRAASGLRSDQAAAAFFVLTSARRAEVLAGPAGTGKTRTAAELAKAWTAAGMGPVVALTTTSAARDVIRAEAEKHAATMTAYNTAEWLGHLPHAREARPPVALAPGTLLILDEASMMTVPDVASVMRRATQCGAKVVLTGDPEQLQAPEAGGGMTLLASRLGWVQLTEAQRFTHAWERVASLRLHDGDPTVMADYREQGRLRSGTTETMLDAAARAWLHDYLSGKDALLMTGDEATAAELSRRVRDDLMHWGRVSDGPVIRIRDGQHASAGDLIMARRNDKLIPTDRPQGITNRDVLRITGTDPHGTGQHVQVQRLTGRDDNGQEVWSQAFDLPAAYIRADTQLAYSVTFHSAEGATVDSGISLFTGTEARQAVNVGMTRGRDSNHAFVITGAGLADPEPGTQAAPELSRYKQTDAQRQGRADPQASGTAAAAAEAESILAQCLARDGRETAALEYQEKAWSDADRLDVLAVQWQHVTRPASNERYAQAVRDALPPQDASMLIADPAAETLWRTLREAEAAGLSPAEAVTRAVSRGPLDTAESAAKVIDWRVKQAVTGLAAQPAATWAEQVPQTSDADTGRFAAELAAAMDDRTRRLGEHTAEHPPAWAQALGPVPADPLNRLEWEHKAAQVAAYREMWGHSHPADPIGPAPGQHSPEARAMWQAAAQALGHAPASLRGKTDGNLWARRSSYGREMAWQPPYAASNLEAMRRAGQRSELEADRARQNAQWTPDPAARERLEQEAAMHEESARLFRFEEQQHARQQEAYDAWEQATRATREHAVAADAELRRRHPDDLIPPLTPAPPPAAALGDQVAVTDDNVWIQLGLDGTAHIPDPEPRYATRDETSQPDTSAEPEEPAPGAEAAPEAWAQDALEGFPAIEPAPEPEPAHGRQPAERDADTPALSPAMRETWQHIDQIQATLDRAAALSSLDAEAPEPEQPSGYDPSRDTRRPQDITLYREPQRYPEPSRYGQPQAEAPQAETK